MNLIYTKLPFEIIINKPKKFEVCLEIFFQSVKSLSSYNDFSTYLFSLEKLIKDFNSKILCELLKRDDLDKSAYLEFLDKFFNEIDIKKKTIK